MSHSLVDCGQCHASIDLESTTSHHASVSVTSYKSSYAKCLECRKVWYCNETCRQQHWDHKHAVFCPGKPTSTATDKSPDGDDDVRRLGSKHIVTDAIKRGDWTLISLELDKLVRRNTFPACMMMLLAGLHDLAIHTKYGTESSENKQVLLLPMICQHKYGADLDAEVPEACELYISRLVADNNDNKESKPVDQVYQTSTGKPTIWRLLIMTWLHTVSQMPSLEPDDDDERDGARQRPRITNLDEWINQDFDPPTWQTTPLVEHLLQYIPRQDVEMDRKPIVGPKSLLFLAAKEGCWDLVKCLIDAGANFWARWWPRDHAERSLTLFDVAWSLEKNDDGQTDTFRQISRARRALLGEAMDRILSRLSSTGTAGSPSGSISSTTIDYDFSDKRRWPMLEYAVSIEDMAIIRVWTQRKTCLDSSTESERFLALDWACCSFKRVDIIRKMVESKTKFQQDVRCIKIVEHTEPIPGTTETRVVHKVEAAGGDDPQGIFRTPMPGHTPAFKVAWPLFNKLGGGYTGRAMDRILYSCANKRWSEWPSDNPHAQQFLHQVTAQGGIVSIDAVRWALTISKSFVTAWWFGMQEFRRAIGSLCPLPSLCEDCRELERMQRYANQSTGSTFRPRLPCRHQFRPRCVQVTIALAFPLFAKQRQVQHLQVQQEQHHRQQDSDETDNADSKTTTTPRPTSYNAMELWQIVASYDERFHVMTQVASLFSDVYIASEEELVKQRQEQLIAAMQSYWDAASTDS